MIEDSAASGLYLDANIFIYALEGEPAVFQPLQELFGFLKAKKRTAVTSELTLAEVLPRASVVERRSYLNLILDLHPVSRDILIETADYRKVAGMPKLPDAIHAVTAIRADCRIIISRDHRLRLPEGYTVVSPDPAALSSLIRDLA